MSSPVVLVTGAAKRIGRAVALDLARRGFDVIVHYRNSRTDAEEAAQEIEGTGQRAFALCADLKDADTCIDLLRQAARAAGTVHSLVNSASVFPADGLLDFELESLMTNVRINAFAPLVLSRELARLGNEGAVVNLLDSRINDYDKDHVAYHLSKRMLYSTTRLLAIDLAPRIRVNGVAPGLVLPPPGQDESYLAARRKTNPLERIGTLEDVTEAVGFAVTQRFVTGQVIYVDGGRNLRGAVYG